MVWNPVPPPSSHKVSSSGRSRTAIIALTVDFNDRSVRREATALGDFLDIAGKLFVKMFGDIAAVVTNGEYWRVAVLVLAAGGPGVPPFQTVDKPLFHQLVQRPVDLKGALKPEGCSLFNSS